MWLSGKVVLSVAFLIASMFYGNPIELLNYFDGWVGLKFSLGMMKSNEPITIL